MDEKTAKALDDIDWSDLLPRLQARAVRLIRIALGGKPRLEEINGYDKNTFIQEAIKRIAEGDRTWNPEKVSLEGFLFGVVQSIISSETKKYYRRLQYESQPTDDESVESSGDLEDTKSLAPDSVTIHSEMAVVRQKTIEALYVEVEDDDELTAILLSFADGITKTNAISEQTDIPPERVSELKRKLKTRLEKIIAKDDSLPTKEQLLEVTP